MTKRLRFGALMAAAAFVIAACTSGGNENQDGRESGGHVTLDLWVFEEGGEGNFLESAATAFEAANPNIEIETATYPESNYGVKVDTAIAAGKAPDLILVFGNEYMRQGLLLPLDDVVAEHQIDLSTYSQAIVEEGDEFSCSWEGKLYCLGSYQGAIEMFYNKDLFDAAGIPYPKPWPAMTPDRFVDIACRLTDPENQVWGAAVADPMAYLPWETYVSPDARTAQGYVNSPSMVHEFETLGRAFADGCAPSLNAIDPWEQGIDFFSRGQIGMLVTGFESLAKLEKAGINYGMTTVPTPADYEPYFLVWTDSVGVLRDSDNPEEAMEFIAFVTTQGQRMRVDTGDIPLDSEVAEEADWAEGIPGRLEGLEVLTHARPSIFVPNRWDVIGPLYDAWGYVVGGEKSAQQALDEAAPDVQSNLDQAWEAWEDQG